MRESDAAIPGSPAKAALDPLVGKVLNERFTILETLGSGGMGRVYKAIQAPLDRLVALKVLNPRYAKGKDPGFQRRFFLEASVTSKLRHPNTITVFDYGRTEDGVFYIVMEYLQGVTLGQVLAQSGPLPWQRVLDIGQQIARSLREAHRAGIIHRDLKPANVMILEEKDHDLVKVLDFGLVKSFLPEAGQPSQSSELTQTGVVLGSPQYMAPEQARNVADPRSDVYSLGVVLFQMLTNVPPFQADLSLDVIAKHIKEPPPTFSQILPQHEIPAEVEALVRKCLEKNPRRRFQSMDELIEGARAVMHALQSGRHRASPPPLPVAVPVAEAAVEPRSKSADKGTVAMPRVEAPAATAGPHRRRTAFFYGLSVVLGLGLAAFLAPRLPGGRAPPSPAPAPPPFEAPRAVAAPALSAPSLAEEAAAADPEPPVAEKLPPVRFVVVSEPRGAKVFLEDRVLGVAPVTFEVPADEVGQASAELTFALDGYQRVTTRAIGSGPEVRVSQKLKKKPAPKPKAPSRAPGGYKDDPYP